MSKAQAKWPKYRHTKAFTEEEYNHFYDMREKFFERLDSLEKDGWIEHPQKVLRGDDATVVLDHLLNMRQFFTEFLELRDRCEEYSGAGASGIQSAYDHAYMHYDCVLDDLFFIDPDDESVANENRRTLKTMLSKSLLNEDDSWENVFRLVYDIFLLKPRHCVWVKH